MMDRLFGSSRFLVLAVIVTSFIAAVILYLVVLSIMFGIVSNLWGGIPSGVTQGKMLAVRLLKVLDISLIAITFQIIAASLYRLFIRPSALEASPFLSALAIRNFHDLKITLLQVAVVIMIILFLEHLVEVGASIETLYLGAGMSMVIAAAIWAWKSMK
ncbi:YqhA family protein [Vibrio metschnikovii]|nr:YqhA family protein [Vibrio metschnikovii]EKO3886288.1 YqhA family protein [Vibrio metschnikovii]EKO3934845.1 YqhA family protein [Vibrio metschnikovii]